ncbi:hypothetical protein EV360DRAFT_56150 [Lentinula raphanica]|nr:hypothetical protein EV360DRAFT_56150 [Lentinula raphanica]
MSLSVDDLVSTLSSSHIGQEALDLAALQTQLAQTLYPQSIAPSSETSSDSFHPPCNTPTGRTPSSSFSWGQVLDVQQRLSRRDEMIDDVEDERMVEDILVPSSPASNGYSASHSQPLAYPHSQKSHHKGHYNSSSFTATDPFYLAQLQAMQNSSAPSALSQFGMPAQQSPFMQQQPRKENFSFSAPSISLETHNILASTSAAFER